MNYVDYRAALGIGFDDNGKNTLFIQRMQLFFHSFDLEFSKASEVKFCYQTGSTLKYWERYEEELLQRMWDYLKPKKTNFKDFLSALVVLSNLYNKQSTSNNEILSFVKKNLVDSHISFDVIEDKDGVFIFPKGVKELDDKLVTEPLQWLTEYPNARIAWINALKVYADATDKNASDCADSFRKALEQFFREFFGGEKSLENYKSEYGKFMKDHGIPAELSNSFEKVQNQYTTYMNNYAKHGNGTSKIALEYIMYQTGSLIRFLITLKQKEK